MARAARRRTVAAMAPIALPRIAPALAAALAAALILALAGPASATPQASSSAKPSACAKATKKLRAAKSRLKRAQRQAARGKASRATVAKARKAVRKAARAKRKACRAPSKPTVPDSSAPPSGGASQPAAPPSQPAPPPAQPPPPPPPSSSTSHALIAKALEEGRIDEETALRYRVFAEFGDSRLPAEFRGSALGVTDTRTLDEVTERWDQLSPATREVLDPFFIPPFNPGSWYELGSAAGRLARVQAGSSGADPGQPGSDLCANTAPNMNRWGYVTAAGGKVRVWYENTLAGQLAKAITVAEYLDSGAWTKVISVFREPLPDGGGLTDKRCRGFDPSLDLVLSGLRLRGRALPYFDKPGCQGPVPGFVLVQRDLAGKELKSTVVHELAHITHYAYGGRYCRDGIDWLTEATAAWTENHVGGLGPEHPEEFAPWFLDRPGLPLETEEGDTPATKPREYGAYLFFQWLAKNKGANAVGQVWYYTESDDHPIDTTQLALRDLGYSGGFTEAWKRFALAGLNPRQEVDWFSQWGLPRGAVMDQDTVHTDDFGVTLPVQLPHLSAQYHDLDFSPAVKGIEVRNPFAGVPGASIQAWLRIDDGGQERIEVRDLSDDEKTTFCREFPSENVQQMALVIANSTHADRTHVLRGDAKVRARPTCGAYDGTATTTIIHQGLTEVYTASYTMKRQWSTTPPGGGLEMFFATGSAHDMHATWSISGTSTSDGCTYSGSASWPAGAPGLEARLLLRDFGKDHPETKYEHGFGVPFKVGTVHRSCPNGHQDDQPWQLGHGFMSQPHPWDPEGQGMTGSETQTTGHVTIEHDWSLSRKEIGP